MAANAPIVEAYKKFDPMQVLTDEQKTTLAGNRAIAMVKQNFFYKDVKFTDEQIAQIKKAYIEATKTGEGEESYKKLNDIVESVLTPEQKAVVEKAKAQMPKTYTLQPAENPKSGGTK